MPPKVEKSLKTPALKKTRGKPAPQTLKRSRSPAARAPKATPKKTPGKKLDAKKGTVQKKAETKKAQAKKKAKKKKKRKLSTASSVESEEDLVQLKQSIGLLNGIAFLTGAMLGSTVFHTPALVFANVTNYYWYFVVWITAGVLTSIAAFTYAELGLAIKKSGSDYAYIFHVFGTLPAFIYLFVNLFIVRPASLAIQATTMAEYVLSLFYASCLGRIPKLGLRLLSQTFLLVLAIINSIDTKWASIFQLVFVALKMVAVSMIIIFGIYFLVQGRTQINFLNLDESFGNEETASLAKSFYSAMLPYENFDSLNQVMEELQEPEHTLPTALAISVLTIVIFYICLNISFIAVLRREDIVKARTGLPIEFGKISFPATPWLVPAIVGASTFAGLNAAFFKDSRLFFVGAKNGHLPAILGSIHIKYKTPISAIILEFLITTIYNWLDLSLQELGVMAAFPLFTFHMLTVAALLKLRWSHPNAEYPIKVNIIVHIISCLTFFMMACLTLYAFSNRVVITLAVALAAICFYVVTVGWSHKPPEYVKFFVKVSRILQAMLLTVGEEHAKHVESDGDEKAKKSDNEEDDDDDGEESEAESEKKADDNENEPET